MTEEELVTDLEKKQENGEISERTAKSFLNLYEFAKDIGDFRLIGFALVAR